MPFYEYTCSACGSASEFLQRVSDPPEKICPHCGEAALIKQISAAGFRLKGKGWYETDFKSDGKRNLAGEHAAAKAEADESTKAAPDKETSSGTTGEADIPKKPKVEPPATQAAGQPASNTKGSTGKRDASTTATSGA